MKDTKDRGDKGFRKWKRERKEEAIRNPTINLWRLPNLNSSAYH
jgi:hypothetical protein